MIVYENEIYNTEYMSIDDQSVDEQPIVSMGGMHTSHDVGTTCCNVKGRHNIMSKDSCLKMGGVPGQPLAMCQR